MKQPAQRSYLSLILFLLYAPLLVIVVMSFNQSTYSTQWAGFTLDWYRTLMEDSSMWQATTHSVILALTTAISASTLATLTAVLLLRKQLPGRKLLMSLILVLIVIPDIIFGIALLLTYNAIKIPFGFWSLLLAHCAFSYPFTLMVIYSRMQDANLDVIEAALDLGASDFTVLTKVLLPILWPAIVSGAPPSSALMWAPSAQTIACPRVVIACRATTLAPVPLNTGYVCAEEPKCCRITCCRRSV